MKLTATTLDTVIKYTASSDQLNKQQLLSKKVGYFYSEKQVFNAIKFATGTQNKRHPLVFLLEASDDIAYTFSDIEDAYNYGLYSYQDLKQFVDAQTGTKKFLMLEKDKTEEATLQEFLRKTQRAVCQSVAKNFANHYDLIMSGIYQNEIIIEDCDEVKCFQALKNFSRVYVFQTKTILDQEVLGFNIINRLLDEFVPVVLKYEKVSMNKYEERIFNNISESAKALYRREAKNATEAEKDYYRLKMAVDFVCNMTDGYAKKVYDTLFT
ncbi:deoxyguanosinetriphosphate triphosphohydrolase-like protein [Enterococcus sp. DIV1537a]|nr:putative dGTPase [Enterococcus faecalis UP2S-6]